MRALQDVLLLLAVVAIYFLAISLVKIAKRADRQLRQMIDDGMKPTRRVK